MPRLSSFLSYTAVFAPVLAVGCSFVVSSRRRSFVAHAAAVPASSLIPTAKLRPLTDPDATPVVIVGCGSFNPVTFLHLRIFEMARDHLHGKRFQVIGGYLSPVSDGYKKKGLLSNDHRIPMCQRALADSDWIDLDTWEARQSEWTRTCAVLDSVQERLNQAEIREKFAKGQKIRVMLVSGGDLVGSFLTPGLWDPEDLRQIITDYGLLIIERYGTDLTEVVEQSPVLQEYRNHIHIIPQPVKNDLSSTKVRELVAQGKSVRYLIPNGAYDYILQHGLYKPQPQQAEKARPSSAVSGGKSNR